MSLRSIQSTEHVAKVTTTNGDPIPFVEYTFGCDAPSLHGDAATATLTVTDWEGLWTYGDVLYVEWSQPHDTEPAR